MWGMFKNCEKLASLNISNFTTANVTSMQEMFAYCNSLGTIDLSKFDFATEEEKKLFLNLISVSGIGPVSALAIIAADDNAGLVQAIESKNITYLTKFPKIGKKTAQQMVLDLEGKVVVASDDLPAKVAVQTSAENQELEEAMEAMLALGYKATELKKIKKFFEGTTDTAENYIKSALKMLVK